MCDFLLSLLNRSKRGLRAHVPKACQLLIFTCQRANEHANVPKACQFLNLGCQRAKRHANFYLRLPKGVPIFQLFFKRILGFFNFSIMLNISKFQEYLGNSRKFISRKKEFGFDIKGTLMQI